MKSLLVGCVLCATAITAAAGDREDRLTVRVSPSVAFAPANLTVRASILADNDNRAMEVVAESEDFYRSSRIQLDGERAPRTTMLEFRSLPPGTYEVRVTLLGSTGRQRSTVRQQIDVMAAGAQ